MKVKIMVGNEVVKDSSVKRTAKVIDPEPEIKVSIPDVEKPREAIFNKTEIQEAVEYKTEEPVDQVKELAEYVGSMDEEELETLGIEVNEITSEEVDEAEKEYFENKEEPEEYYEDEDDYEDDEDETEYEQYLSNRERSQMRKESKSNRSSDMDFGDF